MIDENGNFYGRVWYFHDVTDHKKALKTLYESQSVLAKTEKMARLGSWEYNEKSGKIYFSDNFHELFGYSRAEWRPSPTGFLDRVHPEDREKIPALDEMVSRTGEPVSYEFRTDPSHGPMRYFEARNEAVADNHGRLIRDEHGCHFHRMGFFLDVTERKQAEERIRQLNREKMALLAQVTAMVSHELRNPLGVIRTSNYYLQRHCQGDDQKIEKHFQRIDEQVSMCNTIIEELLEYTQSREIVIARHAVAPWLEQVVQQFEKNEGLAIALRLPREMGPVYHDRNKLMKALVSLLTN
jgi:PAS domain S-box-containing protein